MKKNYLVLTACLLFFSSLSAQQLNHFLGDILVQIKPGVNVQEIAGKLQTYQGQPTRLEVAREISPPMRIWLLHFDFTEINEFHFLHEISRLPEVEIAQFNHVISYRQTVPNDPLFDQQWMWLNIGQSGGTNDADIDLDLAWDLTTGGETATGDEIVVAVIEGCNRNHPDLQVKLMVQ